jgi:ankyrin repeat protein
LYFIRNKYGEVQIHIASRKGDLDLLKQILSTPGVDVNVTDNNKNTPLHEAVNNARVDAVKMLLNFKPYPSANKFFAGMIITQVYTKNIYLFITLSLQ